jgi:CBS domain containing-hemolysin-like protein
MNPRPTFVPADMRIDAARDAARGAGWQACLVGAADRLQGVVTLEQLASASEAGHGSKAVGSLVSDSFAHTHPDHPLDVVLERFAQSRGALPVISRVAAHRVEGVITLDDITGLALGRRRTSTHRPV